MKSSSGPCITHNDDSHAKCRTHDCCIGYNTRTCRNFTTETTGVMKWTAQTATLAYIANELAHVYPADSDGRCYFCEVLLFSQVHGKNCAWKLAREFIDGSYAGQDST